MGRRETVIRICDRCPTERPASDTVEFCYEGVTYKLDLCEKHSDMLSRDLMGWIRLGREAEHPHGGKRWFPGETAQRRKIEPREKLEIPPSKVVINHDAAEESDATPVPAPFELHSNLRATKSVNDDMERLGLRWPQVEAAVENAFAITPAKDAVGVSVYLSDELSVLVTDDQTVIGCAPRTKEDPVPQSAPKVQKRIERKGKRGGQGRIGPRTMEEVIEAIKATPGWEVRYGGKHYRVTGPGGERATLPVTSSDWRGALNAVSELRSIGLDLRGQARNAS